MIMQDTSNFIKIFTLTPSPLWKLPESAPKFIKQKGNVFKTCKSIIESGITTPYNAHFYLWTILSNGCRCLYFTHSIIIYAKSKEWLNIVSFLFSMQSSKFIIVAMKSKSKYFENIATYINCHCKIGTFEAQP